jgi:hypothetical protein
MNDNHLMLAGFVLTIVGGALFNGVVAGVATDLNNCSIDTTCIEQSQAIGIPLLLTFGLVTLSGILMLVRCFLASEKTN